MNAKTYYVYVRGVGITTRLFDRKETPTDIFCSLLNEFDMDLIGYGDNLVEVQKIFLDNILYETYKI